MRIELGAKVKVGDELVGTLGDVVVDPAKKQVTHVVVRDGMASPAARLAPLDLVDEGQDGSVSLHCSRDEFEKLPTVQEYAYLPGGETPEPDDEWDVGVEDVLAFPSAEFETTGYVNGPDPNVGVAYDRVPKGEAEVRRDSPVWSIDGHDVGGMRAVEVEGGILTQVEFESGALWWKKRRTAPADAVTEIETDSITLRLSKQDVKKLPA
jgi:hypothetical protein